MALDAVVVRALCSELSETISGGRIDKIQQPERDLLLISLRSNGVNRKLLFACGTGNARVHLTETLFDNPAAPPMFCMLLRKHLTGAHILSVEQPDFERMLVITLETYDEMGFTETKKLVAELIGKSANLILVGGDGRIIDCMRRMDYAGEELRRLLPGMLYRFPPRQNKTGFFTADSDEIRRRIDSADRETPPDKWLLANFSGLSPLICRELAYRCDGDYGNLADSCEALRESVAAGELAPFIVYENDKPRDFSFLAISQYGAACTNRRCASFSAMLDEFWSTRDRLEQQRRRRHELTHSVKALRDRTAKKLAAQYEELKESEDRETVRRNAELVTVNLYRVQKGQRTLECENYYEPDCPTVTIELDPLKTPQQNSTALYKKYSKLKNAYTHLSVLIAENEKQLDYLDSVLDELERCESERDMADIRRELTETGLLKVKKNARPEKVKPREPLKFLSDDGYEILVGRSNAQNDELTTKLARRTDYWLHTQKVHGSHVIIRCDGLEPPPMTLEQAASLAVYYSQARDGGKIPVDVTMIRNVKKPSGAMPGKVIYTDYKTLLSQSDEELVKRIMRK